MMKKNRPCGGGLNLSDIENCPAIITISTTERTKKRTPKKHRARIAVLGAGTSGITENDILRRCGLSSGRNYCSEIERLTGITLNREDEPNPDGIASHYRYNISNRQDAQKVINLVNNSAHYGGYPGLSKQQADIYLNLYPTE
ncbi:hypothetical protein [Morganella morganii]|uniref:Uncharacterized protein n=1 Tax=Morganella morganii TaxID=582 RepID=A0A1W6JPH9_MORMO|nr:hypothetical protein [Morganella morganii]HDS3051617.1 hypothetical protein [Morganella morganii subsp. morganii]ARM68105.1 hypothetical protein [Morganella morganii]ELA7779638.1 hypothetical protein [Morganella morganii]MBA5857187.1 hypothetical protein [Morganella morganii]HCR3555641.1 hypothetical protein [Morganella morganii]